MNRARYILDYPIRHLIESIAIAFLAFSIFPDALLYLQLIENHVFLNYKFGLPFGVTLFIADYIWAKNTLKNLSK